MALKSEKKESAFAIGIPIERVYTAEGSGTIVNLIGEKEDVQIISRELEKRGMGRPLGKLTPLTTDERNFWSGFGKGKWGEMSDDEKRRQIYKPSKSKLN